ncbi:hypothetical protein F8388_019279 [Cannabis sativa]|uniref:Uncharacterized protein n=1 Tax=Cannabis sativa TaxID=3483 RepID=A0A7J6FRA3_CANSA|nr:hypothetical protein F8388_019279 [Cannabis sativa]
MVIISRFESEACVCILEGGLVFAASCSVEMLELSELFVAPGTIFGVESGLLGTITRKGGYARLASVGHSFSATYLIQYQKAIQAAAPHQNSDAQTCSTQVAP